MLHPCLSMDHVTMYRELSNHFFIKKGLCLQSWQQAIMKTIIARDSLRLEKFCHSKREIKK